MLKILTLCVVFSVNVYAKCNDYTVYGNFAGKVFEIGNATKNNVKYAKGNYVIIWDMQNCIENQNNATDFCGGSYLYDELTQVPTLSVNSFVKKNEIIGCSKKKTEYIDITNNAEFNKKYFD